MSRDVVDLTRIPAESNHPASTARAVVWAAGIGICGVLVLVVLLSTDLVLGKRLDVVLPEAIGTMTQVPLPADLELRQQALDLGADTAYAAAYGDGTGTLVVWGGSGPAIGRADDRGLLTGFRDAWLAQLGGAAVGAAAAVDPGQVGGLAECAGITGDGYGNASALCLWTRDEVLLAMLFGGAGSPGLPPPGERLREVLAAMVIVV
ncbi:hypothetical protein Drose_11575 [Dactylosporangium roseum]|uniref:Uncharacterized protein n=1 Tax=Dactylosporangium roseum TaxID=47989 RepID=A0ABY5Z9L6_9ACTN|nr:hypothetical protein [Dactylosporangium roseum]UWZ38800.1 hypothetical protein Drose_11575 [Dactylosporangium roseum]